MSWPLALLISSAVVATIFVGVTYQAIGTSMVVIAHTIALALVIKEARID